MIPARQLIGYRIDAIEQSPIFSHYAVVWGRKWFWQRSRPLLQICTHRGRALDVYAFGGVDLDFSEILGR